jgi:hypothetical protein
MIVAAHRLPPPCALHKPPPTSTRPQPVLHVSRAHAYPSRTCSAISTTYTYAYAHTPYIYRPSTTHFLEPPCFLQYFDPDCAFDGHPSLEHRCCNAHAPSQFARVCVACLTFATCARRPASCCVPTSAGVSMPSAALSRSAK